ncbi:MAG TPA: isoprenylcysteine carboxylmethyltransferase family protein [Anaeromyxobacteraceae bacterium]|nr:isoprenylcysteine carboxylmethyltransferase family protein [Anaeromyxobacteraceae bacterium]
MSSAPAVGWLKLLATALYLLAWPALTLGLSGDWRWTEGWLFGLWFLGLCATCIGWLYRKDPALLAERFRRPGSGGQSRGDTFIVYALVFGFCAWIALPPLDARRFRWTPRWPLWVEASGGALLLGAGFFFFRSFTDNTFLSPLVRIQAERRHQLVCTGVYAIVRHPMYLGASMMFLGGPLLLGSACGILVGICLTGLLMARIRGEEELLARELDGYQGYRAKVRYRLVPGIW